MADYPPHLTLKLDTQQPIELSAFVGAFTSLAGEFERFIRAEHPEFSDEAEIFVRDVRSGSIIADLVPYLVLALPFIDGMEKVLVIEDFVRRWGSRFLSLFRDEPDAPSTSTELRDWLDAVQAVASDPDASAVLEAATYEGEDKKRTVRAAFKFTTKEAREVRNVVERRQAQLASPEGADHERVLMTFTRSDIRDAQLGKQSGERVRIEELHDRDLALMYASELAEARIKHEIREANDNVFKKGFVVDVNVRKRGGRPVAYAVTDLHSVIDLPD